MKSFAMILCVSVWGCLAAHAVTVNGVATLSGQQNHSGIKVLFREVSPSAQTDSTLTNSWGVFLITLQPGVYDVEYSHADYALYRLPNQILLFDTALDSVMLMPPLSGYLSGTIGPGDFQVTDSIVVAANASLTILPGTRLWFEYRKPFVINGQLTAVGTSTDSILFTRRTLSPDSMWSGLRFIDADDSSRLEYCVIEYVHSPGGNWGGGGGVLIYNSNPSLRYCTVRFNVNDDHTGYGGGGICCVSASPTIENCSITDNISHAYVASGGGVYCTGGSPVFVNCVISRDSAASGGAGGGVSASGAAHFVDCIISDNVASNGAGVSAGSGAHFERCRIINNHASLGDLGSGGVSASGNAEFTECVIARNHGTNSDFLYGAGGIGGTGGVFSRCTIAGNVAYNGSAAVINGTPSLTSCIFVSYGERDALYFRNGAGANIRYCVVYNNDSAAFRYYQSDSSNAPLVFGLKIVTNANGDSCDTYYNLFSDPQFVDTANGDYHLLASSPCIDAGDPELPLDPDGTVADIGAFYFDQLNADNDFTLPPSSFILSAYPNPFNNTTRIVFDLPRAGDVTLSVYDLTGREVMTLVHGTLLAGSHTVQLDANALPSGVYLYRLTAANASLTRKLVLIK